MLRYITIISLTRLSTKKELLEDNKSDTTNHMDEDYFWEIMFIMNINLLSQLYSDLLILLLQHSQNLHMLMRKARIQCPRMQLELSIAILFIILLHHHNIQIQSFLFLLWIEWDNSLYLLKL